MIKPMSFDLEISDDLESGVDWEEQLPIGISCIGFCRGEEEPYPYKDFYAEGESMTQDELKAVIEQMEGFVKSGYTFVSWNGQGFDFPVLHSAIENSELKDRVAFMAYTNHIDMMFHFLQMKGFPISLQKASEGQGLTGKKTEVTLNNGEVIKEMSGILAPGYWRAGEKKAVLEYLKQDVYATHDLYLKTERQKALFWVANSGRTNSLRLFEGWKKVSEVDQLPEPDTSWMSSPPFLTKERFIDWTLTEKAK